MLILGRNLQQTIVIRRTDDFEDKVVIEVQQYDKHCVSLKVVSESGNYKIFRNNDAFERTDIQDGPTCWTFILQKNQSLFMDYNPDPNPHGFDIEFTYLDNQRYLQFAIGASKDYEILRGELIDNEPQLRHRNNGLRRIERTRNQDSYKSRKLEYF